MIVFYHKPVSGSSYELFIIPVCGDTNKLKASFENMNFKQNAISEGVSIGMFSGNELFREIAKNARYLKLINNETLASEFKTIYSSLLYIDFNDVQNNTRSITGEIDDKLKKNLIFENKQSLTLNYFLSNKIKINNVRIIK